MWANKPKLAKKWSHKYGTKIVPSKKTGRPSRKRK
jgi:hypothetical protein